MTAFLQGIVPPLYANLVLCPESKITFRILMFKISLVPRPSHSPVLITCTGVVCKNRFCILQAIKNWTVERPGNEAKITFHS